ncbi:MAG: hypothetical protein IJ014_04750 [Rikenellaceae bacterium]|nr:hypothetical protein [Rikenellaceae bacterium]
MKKYLITIILCLVCVLVVGQDRINRTKLSFNSEGAKLTNFTGWGFCELTGEWFDCTSVIETDKKYATNAQYPLWKSHKFNNIISLQFKTITYNNTPYYTLIWEKWVGAYKYPTIMVDWEYWKTKVFLIFTEENMTQLKSLTSTPVSIKVVSFEKGRYDTNVEDVDIIQTNMNREYIDTDFLIIYKATTGSIRFIFKEYLNNEKAYSDEIEKQYFELNERDYQKLISLSH